MNVFVTVKQTPDPNSTPKLGDDFRLVRDGVELVMDQGDEYGVEEGLLLAEKTGGSVTVVSMGPEKANDAIRKALSMGAESGILITNPALAGSDGLGTARAIAAAVKDKGFDILICGTESQDGSTGMVPPQIAEILGIPHLSFAKKLEVEGNKVKVQRQTADGYVMLEAETPVVVTVTGGLNEPRYPTLKGIMGAKSKSVENVGIDALGLDAGQVGEAGALVKVAGVDPAPERAAGEVISDEGQSGERVAAMLVELKVI
ncbi:MAG: electron transfer flavoprotein subunit beta/FixA family protein [Candidatus Dormibacteraeota bacterium]|nr:electron transfer flavoprotein subunit beta/FixA family protein [Candidatus Dormibacteraeota bacterium]